MAERRRALRARRAVPEGVWGEEKVHRSRWVYTALGEPAGLQNGKSVVELARQSLSFGWDRDTRTHAKSVSGSPGRRHHAGEAGRRQKLEHQRRRRRA